MKKKTLLWRIFWIVLVLAGSLWIVRPGSHPISIGSQTKNIELRKGLDIAGGSHLVYELDLSKVPDKDKDTAADGVIQTIDRRINAFGVTEPTIQAGKIGDKRTVIVELPGISNTQDAINLIGRTAELEFYETAAEGESTDSAIPGFKPTGLTGAQLTDAVIEYQSAGQGSGLITGEPVVKITFNSEGRNKFAEITRRNLSKPVAIIIDKQLVSAPTVEAVIEDGTAIISGSFDVASAKDLAITLKSGQLPVPITLVREQTVGASLGQESIAKSIVAGIVGIILVMVFMIGYYGLRGIIASIALVIYTVIVFAIFKFIPVTLTLPGIAGLILSIGAAVDANILIFERMKEEERQGKQPMSALNEGFKRAWSSIRDSNIASIIIAIILIWFGSGIVKGFAITLIIGILVSMFTAITVSQTLLVLFSRKAKS